MSVHANGQPAICPTDYKLVLPEQVLVYHSGTGRTVLVGSLKLTTIFAFAFFTVFAGPTFYSMEDQPVWVAPAVVLSGAIPMVAVMYYYGPFVNYIHIRLPSYARKSRELMIRYVKALPKETELDITTMGGLGRLRMSRVKLQDLYPINQRLGLANIGRDTKDIDAKRRWYARPVRKFGVHPGRTVVMGDVWKKVAATIANRAKPS
ncbi:hypothetical protein BJ875DRAFT_378223 [Amylocarpus encephaloides]|uniref:Uncharacterized protein n=1 Tax=Amylocarpus encephaloides TaxID=45428 RepID=A0A9P8C626_9HELO|nr:hypothetical protein BJ875DRAFT_378223 [Amylocarpus encephaloides]